MWDKAHVYLCHLKLVLVYTFGGVWVYKLGIPFPSPRYTWQESAPIFCSVSMRKMPCEISKLINWNLKG